MTTPKLVEGQNLTAQGEKLIQYLRENSAKLHTNGAGSFRDNVLYGKQITPVAWLTDSKNAASVADAWKHYENSYQYFKESADYQPADEGQIALTESVVDDQQRDVERRNAAAAQQVIDLLVSGEDLTEVGKKLAEWLAVNAKKIGAFTDVTGKKYTETAKAAQHYMANVPANFTPAKYLATFNDYTPQLYGIWQDTLIAYARAEIAAQQESAVMVNGGHLTKPGQHLAAFLTESVQTIANYAKADLRTQAAAKHYRQVVINGRATPTEYFNRYPQSAAILNSTYALYLKAGGEQATVKPAPTKPQQPKLVSVTGRLTELGETVTAVLQAEYRAGKMRSNHATRAWIAFTEHLQEPPATFFRENPNLQQRLHDYCLEIMQESLGTLKQELKAVKHG